MKTRTLVLRQPIGPFNAQAVGAYSNTGVPHTYVLDEIVVEMADEGLKPAVRVYFTGSTVNGRRIASMLRSTDPVLILDRQAAIARARRAWAAL